MRSYKPSPSKPTNPDNGVRRRRIMGAVIITVFLFAAAAGIFTGNWINRRNKQAADMRSVDEYHGLGQHTGLPGNLELQVYPMTVVVYQGQPVKVKITLHNIGSHDLMLNDWLTPYPAGFETNQFPLKVAVTSNNRMVRYIGNQNLLPPHTSGDFIRLGPGQNKEFWVDLTGNKGKWDMSALGTYTAEFWYETYLTGKYIGVDAWTGMTNHALVQIIIRPAGSTSQ